MTMFHLFFFASASAPAYVVTSPTVVTWPTYVVRFDNRSACQAAGGRWHSWAQRCDF